MKFLAGFVWISSCTKSMAQNLGNLLNSLSIPPMRKKSCHHWARPHSHLVKKCKRSVDQFDSHFPLEHCHQLWKMLGHKKKNMEDPSWRHFWHSHISEVFATYTTICHWWNQKKNRRITFEQKSDVCCMVLFTSSACNSRNGGLVKSYRKLWQKCSIAMKMSYLQQKKWKIHLKTQTVKLLDGTIITRLYKECFL